MRYFDSLHVEAAGNKVTADLLRQAFKEKRFPEVLPPRSGRAARLAECGLFVCHWMEEEVRRALGEGGGLQDGQMPRGSG